MPAPERMTAIMHSVVGANCVVAIDQYGNITSSVTKSADNGFDDDAILSVNTISKSGDHGKTLIVTNNTATYTISVSTSVSVSPSAMCNANVYFRAEPVERSGRMICNDVNVTRDTHGELEGHTIFGWCVSIPGYLSILDNLQHFEWEASGPWTDYSPQNMWPHKNIRVEWHGSGESLSSPPYTYNPTYQFNYEYWGCSFMKYMLTVYDTSTRTYMTSPTQPDTLKLKLTDLGDDFSIEEKLNLYVHYPVDNWEQDDVKIEGYGPIEMNGSQSCQPGQSITINHVKSHSATVTFSVSVNAQTDAPAKVPLINIPVKIGADASWTKEVTNEEDRSVQTGLVAPDGAYIVQTWLRATVNHHYGTTSTWNKLGKVADLVATDYIDPDSADMHIGLTFFGSDTSWVRYEAEDRIRGWS